MNPLPHDFPGIELLELQRENSIAQVWKARQCSLSRIVCVEQLRESFVTHSARLERYLEVARAIARQKHPNLVQIYDVHAVPPSPYLLMEYISGPSLADVLSEKGRLPPSQTATVGRAIASAMSALWDNEHIVHANIKPSEIRMDGAGIPRLTSFGSAFIAGPGPRPDIHDGWVVGTPNYLAPEQCRGEPLLDFHADMYALGATLYHCLTGCLPFAGDDPETILRRQIEDTLPHPRQFNPTLPPSLCAILARMMMKKADHRYTSWSILAEDLDRAAAGRSPRHARTAANSAGTIAPPPRPAKASGRRGEPKRPREALHPNETAAEGFLQYALWLLLGVGLFFLARSRWEAMESQTRNARPRPSGFPVSPPSPLPPPAAVSPAPPVVPPVAAPATAAQDAIPSEIRDELARTLIAGDRVAFRRIVQRNLAIPGIDALRATAEALPDPDSLAEAGIMAHRGQPIEITHRGQRRTLVPISSLNGEIMAELRDPSGVRQVPFRVSQLSASERLRWMPAPNTPESATARAMLLLQDGRSQEAEALAARCGPLAPIIRHAARIPQ